MNILIHGFNVKNPNETVGKLRRYLKDTMMFNYGWFGLISVLLCNRREAKKLKSVLINKKLSNIYAHSNGCAIAVDAAKRGGPIDTLICINPALKRKTKFPINIKRIIVVHTDHDVPTKAAAFFDKIPVIGWFIINAWGSMGAYGASRTDSRLINIDMSNELNGHSDFFDDYNIVDALMRIQTTMKQKGY